MKPDKVGLRWAKEDEEMLVSMVYEGKTLEEAYRVLQRSKSAIVARLIAMRVFDSSHSMSGGKFITHPSLLGPNMQMLKWAKKRAIESKPRPKESEIIMTKTFETKTFIHGVDAESLTDAQIFARIGELEAEVLLLERIKNKPRKLLAAVEALNEDIQKLVTYVDSRP